MYLSDIYKALSILFNIKNKKVNNIVINSKEVKRGDVFICLKGEKYDGNDYIKDALKKGALLCITTKYTNNKKCVRVEDTYESLYKIASYIRNKYNIPLIAITGSNGKTTTKELIYKILEKKYKVLKNIQNENNIIGVSKTLLKLNNKYDLIVMEFGTNHVGEISKLSNICKPNMAIITNIGTAHIGNFNNKKNIFNEKLNIINNIDKDKIFINGDDKYLKRLKYFKCGINEKNNLRAYDILCNNLSISFKIMLDKEYKFNFNNPGVHFINDILLAIKVGIYYNIDIKSIIKSVDEYKIIHSRMNYIDCNRYVLIDDCYNSSYESLISGLNYLKNIKNKKIIILGDILELGKYSKKIHKKINKYLKSINTKEVLTIGNYTKYIKGVHFNNINNLIDYIKKIQLDNSYIYIKGSRLMHLENIVNYLKR